MSPIIRRIEQLTWVGLAAMGLGLATLVIYSWVEYVNSSGMISIEEGYWRGRVPWTPLGVVLVIAGATGSLVAGIVAASIRGGWARRILLVPVLAMPVLWWFAVIFGYPRYQPIDPVTFAYSLPIAAAIALIVPAVAMAALVFLPVRPDSRVRIRQAHPA